tara:strand:+ start:1404 stop:3158 length:1755 start_codon:yes stop_codon:yes gene_type:complete
MVKSLIGKADGTLVNAAFAEAKSQVPADMSGIMATMTATQKQLDKQFVDMTTELFGNINSANEEMQELVDPIYKSLQSGTFTDADVLSFKPVVDGFKDEWKLIPKGKEGDEARLLWKNKVNKFKNTIASFDQKLLELTTNVAGENYLPAGLQGIGGRDADKNLKFLSSIYRLKSGKEGNKATMTVDEKGEVFFSANIDGEEIKMSMQQIEDLMPTKDMNLVKNVDALLMNYKKSGATKGSIYDAAGLSDKVFNLLNTAKVPKNAFQTLAHYDYGRGSFFQDLYSPSGPMGKTISEAIKGVQYSADVKDKFDTDGVPGISAGDFTNENRKAIADYIMSNDKIGRRVLSNWFAATEGQSAFNDGRNLIPKGTDTDKSSSSTFLNYLYYQIPGSDQKRSGSAVMNLRNQVKNIVLNKTQNNSFTGYFGDYIYQKEGKNAGEFFHKQDNKYISIYDVLTKEGLYDSKDQFDLGLSSSGIDVQPLKLSDFAEAPKVIDIFNIINDAYTSKNKQVKEVTGSSGGLRVEKSGSKIKLYEGGTLLKTFKFNPGTGSEDFIKSVDGQKLLQELINNVNGSLNPNFVDDKYNIG